MEVEEGRVGEEEEEVEGEEEEEEERRKGRVRGRWKSRRGSHIRQAEKMISETEVRR